MGELEVGRDVPELVPVRILNEHVYCPRLAYLEWSSKLFTDNDFTSDGRWQHRAVDIAKGSAPLPEDGDLIEARSIDLSSQTLGLTGKIDIVEGRDGAVVPIEIKRGSPATTPERVWPPELVQIRAYGLLLSDNGYTCHEGSVFFAQTRERVAVEFTDELTELTLRSIAEVRKNASSTTAPPRLKDSRKCDGCSLVSICLPDEIPFLRKKRLEPPRRLIPTDNASRPLYVNEPGMYVGKSGGRIVLTKRRETVDEVRLIDVSQLCVYGNVQVSTQLLRELMSRDVPICWFSSGGWLNGITSPMLAKHVELRRRQTLLDEEQQLAIARSMVEGKIRNSRTLLRRNAGKKDEEALDLLRKLVRRAGRADSFESLLGFEGAAARTYFGQFQTMLRSPEFSDVFQFAGRNRRPPVDPVNCLLSFVYGLLTKDCLATLLSVGFDPYQGFLHRPRFGRPALALDLAEEFRSVIGDSVVLNTINNGEISPSQFVVRAGGVGLTSGTASIRETAPDRDQTSGVRIPHHLASGAGGPGTSACGRGDGRTRALRSHGHPVGVNA